jgi:hypothetical protein
MQISGSAATGANSQPPREMRFRSSGKRRRLFMSHMNPLKSFLCANRVRNAVERVAGNTVDLPNSCFRKHIHQQVRYFLGHIITLRGVSPKLTMLQPRRKTHLREIA